MEVQFENTMDITDIHGQPNIVYNYVCKVAGCVGKAYWEYNTVIKQIGS